jgi:hypothetical protein
MGFLHPVYLWAALAALAPLFIHLLYRQRARIQIFPSLEFLRRMMRKKTQKFHLKRTLLLIIRILLLLFIALALAGPTITRGRVARGHLPTVAVIILDNSYSMSRKTDGRELFEVAREKALALLDYFDRGDLVYLLSGSRPARNLTETGAKDAMRVRQLVRDMSCSNRVTDVSDPLKQAVALVSQAERPNKEIYIISDMRKIGWDGLTAVLETAEDTKLMVIDLGSEDANACVREIDFRIPAGSDELQMEVTFERFNYTDRQGRMAEAFLKGALLERMVFSPGDFSREKEDFRIPAFEGYLWGEVAMAEDGLPLDDKRYFALPSRRRVVGVVGDGYYVSTALSPKGGGGFQAVEIEPGAINRENLARLDVLVLSNVSRLSPLEIESLDEFLATGGSLLVFLGDQVDIGAYNRNFLGHLGDLRIEGPSQGGPMGFFTIDRFERGHRIFAKFKPDQSPFSEAKFYRFMKIDPDGGHVVASFSDGSPALVEVGERVMVMTSAADLAWGDFVLTSQFLPLVHETLLYLSARARLSQSYTLPDEIVLRGGLSHGEVILEGPGGAVRHFPEALGAAGGYRIQAPEEPGVYFLRTEDETLSVFAVNVDTSESDLTKVALDQVKSKLPHLQVSRVTGLDDVGESVSTLRQGRGLSRSLLWAGLLLIILETVLASNLWQRLRANQEEDAFTSS